MFTLRIRTFSVLNNYAERIIDNVIYWPRLDTEVEKLIQTCHPCQAVSQAPSKCEPLKPSEIPKRSWHTLALDIQGPYPTGDYLLVLIDYRSRYPVVCQLRNISEKHITKALQQTFMLFGYPKSIVTDNGTNFKSSAFQSYLQAHGISQRIVTPYWPSANGEVERFNRVLKKFNQIAHAEGHDWRVKLQEFLLFYRSTPHSITGETPAKVLFGRNIRNGIPSIEIELSENKSLDLIDKQNKERGKIYTDKKRNAKENYLRRNDLVLLKNLHKQNKLSTEYEYAPYKIIKVYPRSCQIVNEKGKYVRSKAHLKLIRRAETNTTTRHTEDRDQRIYTEAQNIGGNHNKNSICHKNLNNDIYSDLSVSFRADPTKIVKTPIRVEDVAELPVQENAVEEADDNGNVEEQTVHGEITTPGLNDEVDLH